MLWSVIQSSKQKGFHVFIHVVLHFLPKEKPSIAASSDNNIRVGKEKQGRQEEGEREREGKSSTC